MLNFKTCKPLCKEFGLKGVYAYFLNSLKEQINTNKYQFQIAINAEAPLQIVRDMVHVDDFSRSLLKFLNGSKNRKEIFNISSSKAIYLEDIAYMALAELLEKEPVKAEISSYI